VESSATACDVDRLNAGVLCLTETDGDDERDGERDAEPR
jgi:hypothetical protein